MSTEKVEKLSEIVTIIFRLNGQLLIWGEHFAQEFGLTAARWQVLGAIDMAEKPLTAPQIAKQMGMTRQGVQKQLNLLLAEKYLEKQTNLFHKSSPYYVITPQGFELYQKVKQRWFDYLTHYQQNFSLEELETTQQTFNQLLTMINKEK